MEVPAINGWQNSPVESKNDDDAGEVAEDEEERLRTTLRQKSH